MKNKTKQNRYCTKKKKNYISHPEILISIKRNLWLETLWRGLWMNDVNVNDCFVESKRKKQNKKKTKFVYKLQQNLFFLIVSSSYIKKNNDGKNLQNFWSFFFVHNQNNHVSHLFFFPLFFMYFVYMEMDNFQEVLNTFLWPSVCVCVWWMVIGSFFLLMPVIFVFVCLFMVKENFNILCTRRLWLCKLTFCLCVCVCVCDACDHQLIEMSKKN